ncbi:bifunctional diaminohydroxyphosphoribosylaminopyrimidine deaminase/5-amino-6-(5-phosphoribosylamino)uracil reductase RibD [Halopseudomonas aestusnigri]|jgi:diaminohydroxyphosphoribosylaminopyrimidine deaminase/5-amino-6-(5-phosphoribosylamino)uracil reductase|uniref:bifunctional diaminohydroxyphosphoribosylaminopyrimidine deaminase/5-amino-6-(5-phosphoribosylamino)uracil reductase RibD n=1 Tax=Halopseudomonas aestusnigri TaxID=857252 RepID=UPI0025568E53|nr:bifunctional diaminohydroxyphosphoribosylaminopyrimidine deaminase/5-amino-6-(5-phosphoribosylamino)uracil reductase RibD [Halopseudomonas aestusnigri]MDL2200260.1 bifunctional diaminohydroxyphosphoribosylaminopyrimidine deaminase/5-amino-6-(5-phosphoribosylamino)uracil reductase RibD [Halopseudomonas aestusnigri]|tara:strand:+ start:23839 stop:24969 length:1131 start_codon:yes stop_codon:yes gene_type:complete
MPEWSAADREWMSRALMLAERGVYTTEPNPRVGCVLVADGRIVGEGWHVRAGEGHAEVNALAQAGDLARGATAYVTLEPCSHFGRTPPCADALVKAGVSRVVAAMQDPNPQVAGNGLNRLREAGIEVDCGLLEAQAQALNPGFIKRMQQGLPWVRVKLAMSLDGRTAMASGESKWITGPAARADVQRLRARSGAVVSGADSVLLDDSALTVRAAELGLPADEAAAAAERQPLRVLIDSLRRVPLDQRFFRETGPTLVISTSAEQAADDYRAAGSELLAVPGADGKVDLHAVLQTLAERGCNEVLVEAGAGLSGAFWRAGLVDELIVYMAPRLLGSQARPLMQLPFESMSEAMDVAIVDMRAIGQDWRITARPIFPS